MSEKYGKAALVLWLITMLGGATAFGTAYFANGTNLLPGIAFGTEVSTGFFKPNDGELSATAQGTEVARFHSYNLGDGVSTSPLSVPDLWGQGLCMTDDAVPCTKASTNGTYFGLGLVQSGPDSTPSILNVIGEPIILSTGTSAHVQLSGGVATFSSMYLDDGTSPEYTNGGARSYHCTLDGNATNPKCSVDLGSTGTASECTCSIVGATSAATIEHCGVSAPGPGPTTTVTFYGSVGGSTKVVNYHCL